MKRVSLAILLGTAWLCPSLVLAQGAPAPAPEQGQGKPADLTVAPNAAPSQADQQTPQRNAGARGPANICQELVTFLQPKPPAAPPAPAPGTAAQSGPSPQQSATTSPQAQPGGQGGTPQQTSGQAAPIAQDAPKAKPMPVSLEEAQGLAGSNDFRGCQDATRKLRLVGAALPAGLLALAALKPENLQPGQP